jgi:hypothetical protein
MQEKMTAVVRRHVSPVSRNGDMYSFGTDLKIELLIFSLYAPGLLSTCTSAKQWGPVKSELHLHTLCTPDDAL